MKKRVLSFIMIICILVCSAVPTFAYAFPEPDWGALLREKEAMVNEIDFELYAEGPIDYAPYYGEKFEPRGGTYIGSIAETSDKLRPLGSYLTYVEDMYQDDLYFPANSMITNDNVIATVGWTINDMGSVDYNQVRKVLDNLSKYNKPMFIRFANEMNCSNLGDEPDFYVEVFRKVADMVHEYPNFAVVWSPIDIGSLDRPFEYYYPGDEYVDWVGLSSYVMKYFMGDQSDYKSSVYFMTGNFGWSTNKVKPLMDFMQKNNINKPVMISEGGVATSHKNGEENEEWATPRFRNMLYNLIMKYPQIKLINIFDNYRGYETERYNISEYPYAVDIFNEAKNSGAYITQYGGKPEFVYTPAYESGTLVAKNGVVPLYTLAYFPNQTDYTVNYYVDDQWYGAKNQAPYKLNMTLSDFQDGAHTLKISTLGSSKEYTFYKKGQAIKFGGEPEGDYSTPINVIVNGDELDFSGDQSPVIVNDRTLVPLRKIFEALGAEVLWNGEERTVNANKSGIYVSLTIDSNIMYVDGTEKTLDVSAQIIGDRTMVPVRAIAEAFGANVEWDGQTRTVYVEG